MEMWKKQKKMEKSGRKKNGQRTDIYRLKTLELEKNGKEKSFVMLKKLE